MKLEMCPAYLSRPTRLGEADRMHGQRRPICQPVYCTRHKTHCDFIRSPPMSAVLRCLQLLYVFISNLKSASNKSSVNSFSANDGQTNGETIKCVDKNIKSNWQNTQLWTNILQLDISVKVANDTKTECPWVQKVDSKPSGV